jgi:membrane-associated phospholipid phosphatase
MRVLAALLVLVVGLESVDLRVRDLVQPARTPALEGVMRGASNLGKPGVVLGGLLAVAVFAPGGVAVARAALFALAGTNLVVEGLKRGVERARPDGERDRKNSSFPSSHAANAFALAFVFARRWRRAAAWFWIAAAIVAFSRVYLNRHYFSDVLAGAAIGTVMAWWMPSLMDRAANALARRRR